jgi:hypothetical protein
MVRLKNICVVFLGLMVTMASTSHRVQAAEVAPLLKYYSQDYWVLLGGSKGGKWLPSEAVAPQLKGKEKYRLYTLTGPVGTAPGAKPGPWGQADPPFLVRLKPIPQVKDQVAVGGRWNAMPRQPRLLTDNLQPYVEAAAEILRSKGIIDPKVNLTQAIEIDLDGDGVKEVVVSATRFTMAEPSDLMNEGDYSMVFVHKEIKGGANHILVDGKFQTASRSERGLALTYRVGSLIDADGDGVMEILVHYTYYEGGGARLYELKRDKVESVLGEDWGL